VIQAAPIEKVNVEGESIMEGAKLLEELQRACGEIGQATEPMSEDELRASTAAAEALAAELTAAGISPVEVLQARARKWGELRAGVLRDDSGRKVFLTACVDFLSFYRHRHAAVAWLNS
jgi:hypothetical protein